jgi:hypothetical protein
MAEKKREMRFARREMCVAAQNLIERRKSNVRCKSNEQQKKENLLSKERGNFKKKKNKSCVIIGGALLCACANDLRLQFA